MINTKTKDYTRGRFNNYQDNHTVLKGDNKTRIAPTFLKINIRAPRLITDRRQ